LEAADVVRCLFYASHRSVVYQKVSGYSASLRMIGREALALQICLTHSRVKLDFRSAATMDDYPKRSFRELEEWVKSGVTLVGFESPSCLPCRDQQPIIETLAGLFKGEARVIDLNIDDNRQFAIRMGITSIPTLIVFKNGRELQRFVGLQSVETLAKAIEAVLG
jgi:thioredoxin 1